VACDIEVAPLPFADGTFDAVLMCEVFEHLRINPVRTMHEVHRVVRPGGFLHLTTPNLFSLGGIRNFLLKRSTFFCTRRELYDELNHINVEGFSGHVREYTHREVEGFLSRVGFAPVRSHFRFGGLKGWTRPVYAVAPFLRPNVAVHAFR
jgi:SAM-dependent methyltransferase